MNQVIIILSFLLVVVLTGCPKKPTESELRSLHHEKVLQVLDEETLDDFDTGSQVPDVGPDGSSDAQPDLDPDLGPDIGPDLDPGPEEDFDIIGC